jgi:hypothetical protein
MKECHFKPKLNIGKRNNNEVVCHRPEGDTFYRNKVWQDSIKARLEKQREDDFQRDGVECTFQPNLSLTISHNPPRKSAHIQSKLKGVNKFLHRQ